MDTTSIKHLGNNDGYTLEMFVSFSLDSSKCAHSFKMSFHFQNVLSFYKMSDGDKFFNAFEGTRITKLYFV